MHIREKYPGNSKLIKTATITKPLVRYVLSVFVIDVLILIALTVMHLYSLDFFRTSQATDLIKTVRNDFLMGAPSRALRQLSARTGPDQSFISIEMYDSQAGGRTLINDRYGDIFEKYRVKNRFLYGRIKIPLLFEGETTTNYGHIIFYYDRLSNSSLAIYVWIVLVIVIGILAVKQRISLQKSIEWQLTARKNETIASMIQMLSHDMRAPLGTFEHLLNIPTESFDDMRGPIRESLHRLHSMIESFRYSELEVLIKPQFTKPYVTAKFETKVADN